MSEYDDWKFTQSLEGDGTPCLIEIDGMCNTEFSYDRDDDEVHVAMGDDNAIVPLDKLVDFVAACIRLRWRK